MIDFNLIDFNLKVIRREAGFKYTDPGYKQLEGQYRVYGLTESDNPLILVKCSFKVHEHLTEEDRIALFKYFRKNKMQLLWQDVDSPTDKEVSIGLRYDLRNYSSLAAAALQTIVWFLEGKLELRKDCIPFGIPRFEVE